MEGWQGVTRLCRNDRARWLELAGICAVILLEINILPHGGDDVQLWLIRSDAVDDIWRCLLRSFRFSEDVHSLYLARFPLKCGGARFHV